MDLIGTEIHNVNRRSDDLVSCRLAELRSQNRKCFEVEQDVVLRRTVVSESKLVFDERTAISSLVSR